MSLLTAIRACWYAQRLDDAIIAGARRNGSPGLASRVQRPTGAAFRADLARSSEAAGAPPYAGRSLSRGVTTAAIRPPAEVALLAGPVVRGSAGRLRAPDDPDPRGVAPAIRLVTEGASPPYVGTIDEPFAAIGEIEAALRCSATC